MHNILDVFQFQPDWTTHKRVSCPWTSRIGENGVLFTLLEKYSKYFDDILAGSQVSDRCPLGYFTVSLMLKLYILTVFVYLFNRYSGTMGN